jgi:hypothetical protein
MQIIKFHCAKLNAFLKYDLTFFSDVSFLHGINGSGKTTILRAIASLLTPDPIWLFNTVYEYVEVQLEHNSQSFTIRASKASQNSVNLTVSGALELEDTISADDMRIVSKGDDEFYRYVTDPDELAHRIRFFNDNNKTFSFVHSLPTPIFLGLDRTTLTPLPRPSRPPQRGSRVVHPYFRTQLDDAILEADRLLTRQLSILSSERNKIFEELRNQFVLSLFRIPGEEGFHVADLEEDPRSRYDQMRYSVVNALRRIDVSEELIEITVEPFFQEIALVGEIAYQARQDFVGQKTKSDKARQEYVQKIGAFFNFRPFIEIIQGTLTKSRMPIG